MTITNNSSHSDYLTMQEAMDSLSVHKKLLVYLIKDKQFPNAVFEIEEWKIPIEDITMYKKKIEILIKSPCLDLKEAAERLNYTHPAGVLHLIYTHRISGVFKFKKKCYIPLKSILELEKAINDETSLTINEVTEILNSKREIVDRLIRKGTFPNSFKGVLNEWRITKIDLENYLKSISSPKEIESEYLIVEQAARYLGFTNITNINSLIQNNTFPNAIYENKNIKIPKLDLDKYLNSISATNLHPKTQEIPSESFINQDLETIKLSIIKEFNINELTRNTNNDQFSNKAFFLDLVDTIIENFNNINIAGTTIAYIKFCQLQINNLSGSIQYRLSRVKDFTNLYIKFSKIIQHDYSLTHTNLLSEESKVKVLTVHQKQIFSKFIYFYLDLKGIIPKERVLIKSNKKSIFEKEIYTPEEFYNLYNYSLNIELHIEKALQYRNYANMWTYVLLLLTDFIRGQDLIINTPNIEIEELLDIVSLDWFKNNTLDEAQANIIIKQLYLAFRHKRTSKTDELLTFIISPDIVMPLANALTISELHRRKVSSDKILDSFIVGKYQIIKTQGKKSHLHFFDNMKTESDFTFGSQKLNNSVATYLFYSIAEHDGQDSDLALHLVQKARSHTKAETTSIYIQATNRDGSINKISYNIFKRGHFGWLYNHLILFSLQLENIEHNLAERTNLIEEMRKDLAPYEINNISKFVYNNLKQIDQNNDSENMETFITNMYKKRQSIISKLYSFSKEDIINIIKKLAAGELPAKNENCQCLIYPKCQYPNLTNCFSCEFAIPSNFMLIQLNEELNKLFNEIEKSTNEIMLKKYSKFLLHALFIFKEARISFGDNYVNGFISINDVKEKIFNISEKIYID